MPRARISFRLIGLFIVEKLRGSFLKNTAASVWESSTFSPTKARGGDSSSVFDDRRGLGFPSRGLDRGAVGATVSEPLESSGTGLVVEGATINRVCVGRWGDS